ncbi:MAG: hypothetical protein COU10_02105 [Candidatus Harrisonbacteria bacterium CG10_big_fil_rev_8_21_14_0_10_45_28]|uniref:Uncharacterized protein n=1 Tax=Candidatus Harrisonbacteria bacterium CG10_big_fil_rev_8_21_14_0_10_45_28 TaxID=1974586 RepID=A0A2H0UNC2_9BACT|nr:MAG: hypothetical protein COU10_02105 [Candidatus Harrisonbacteria bacterium CG10_big_fil_rev_8_21_14_0_10_45_28]
MKKALKVIVISIVIVGMIAMYVFSGFNFTAPAPNSSQPAGEYYPETIPTDSSSVEQIQNSNFQGPPAGSEPFTNGPTSLPSVQGPVAQ